MRGPDLISKCWKHVGHCPGIENYSRLLAGRKAGETPKRCTIFSRKIFCCSSTNRTSRFPRFERCMPATAAAKKRWSSMDFVCPVPGQSTVEI